VQIYDYVDVHVPVLERMYQKRLRGYAAIGYKAKSTTPAIEEIHSIFDNRTFFSVYMENRKLYKYAYESWYKCKNRRPHSSEICGHRPAINMVW